MGEEKICSRDAGELAACFAADAGGLFGYACVLVRGDRALADDLVQAAFEAAAPDWGILRCLAEEQRRAWLRTTVTNIAVSGFRREAAWRDRLPRIEARYRKNQADTETVAFSLIVLDRCWQIIKDMPEQQHAVAVLRWQQGMKQTEIAAALGMAEKTVSVHLHRARRRLIAQLGPDYPFASDDGEGRRQAARFAAGYDMAAGLDRYREWLDEHTSGEQARPQATRPDEHAAQERARPQAIPVRMPAELRAALAGSGASIAAAVPARPIQVTETLVAKAALGAVLAEWDAEQAVTALYSTHYRSLVGVAILLVRDVATAEEVVQDSFIALYTAWPRLRDKEDKEKALSYLRQCVVRRSRSVLRHRMVVNRNASKPAPDPPAIEQGALTMLERRQVVAALRSLPPRQREALVLRYYGDLSEAQIALAMGISRGAVRSHTARAIASLRAVLETET